MKQYDPNMIIEDKIGSYDVEFHSVDSEPFRLYGIWRDGDVFSRIPKAIAETVSEGVARRYSSTAGGRVRFVTDSSFVAVKVEYEAIEKNDIMPMSSTIGIDLYVDGEFAVMFRTPLDMTDGYTSVAEIPGSGERVITLNLPSHSIIKTLHVGVARGAALKRSPDYKIEKPVVFYGSSITHGACASRPGMTYENQISRKLDMNYHNLGFGGRAKGEANMAKYIASLDMSVFVFDYDHNSPNPENLEATHEPFFKIIREKNPTLPIVMISRPTAKCGEESTKARFDVIKRTYDNAKASGDNNVYLINGLDFFGELGMECTVDGTHPTDLGFYLMANKIAEVLKPLL